MMDGTIVFSFNNEEVNVVKPSISCSPPGAIPFWTSSLWQCSSQATTAITTPASRPIDISRIPSFRAVLSCEATNNNRDIDASSTRIQAGRRHPRPDLEKKSLVNMRVQFALCGSDYFCPVFKLAFLCPRCPKYPSKKQRMSTTNKGHVF